MPANALIVSNDEYGGANPQYPPELQPRDRARAYSQVQIQDMSRRLNPRLLADSPTAQNGAPIVRGDGAVIGGNARAQAIATAYNNGRAAEYEQFIRESAGRYGIDAETMPEKPVLVRIASGVDDWTALSQELNASTTATYSATEQAMTDAQKMGGVLELLVANDEGNINNVENRAFINAFVSRVVPASERGAMLTKDGLLSQAGLERAEYAVFAYAYEDPALLAKLSESLDNDARNVTNALLASAPKGAEIRAGVESGTLHDTGAIGDILRGVGLYANAKFEGIPVEDLVAQASLLDRYTNEETDIAAFLEKNKRSAAQIRIFFNSCYKSIENMGDPNQVNLFGGDANEQTSYFPGAVRIYERESGREFAGAEFGGSPELVINSAESSGAGREGPNAGTQSNSRGNGKDRIPPSTATRGEVPAEGTGRLEPTWLRRDGIAPPATDRQPGQTDTIPPAAETQQGALPRAGLPTVEPLPEAIVGKTGEYRDKLMDAIAGGPEWRDEPKRELSRMSTATSTSTPKRSRTARRRNKLRG